MANITITVPDAAVPRILNAMGSWVYDPANPSTPPVWTPATNAQAVAQVKAYVKQKVRDYEAQQAQITKAATVDAEVW